jgi:F0F1-type ATP synthase membrane subunit b/b'
MMHISTTTDDYIYIFLGVVFGLAIMANLSSKKAYETFDQVDKRVRDDLEYYKNLSESLAQDKVELKQQLEKLKNDRQQP